MFVILFEVLLIEIQEEIHDVAGWKGGLRGPKIVNKNFVNKLAFPTFGGTAKEEKRTRDQKRRRQSIPQRRK